MYTERSTILLLGYIYALEKAKKKRDKLTDDHTKFTSGYFGIFQKRSINGRKFDS